MTGRLHMRRLHQWETIGIACHVCRRGEGYNSSIPQDEDHCARYQHVELKRLQTFGPHRLRRSQAYCPYCHLVMIAGFWETHIQLDSHVTNEVDY
jgi:hypothetical protein